MRRTICFLLSVLMTVVPVYAAEGTDSVNEAAQTAAADFGNSGESKAEVLYDDDDRTPNLKVLPAAQDELDLQGLDIYRITYHHEERDHWAHMDIDAGEQEITGYLEPGTYTITGITYIGSRKILQEQPAATLNVMRLYSGQVTEIPLAVGNAAIESLKSSVGSENMFTELNVKSGVDTQYTYQDLELDGDPGSMQNPLVDESVFGDDEEAKEEYRKQMREQGYLDAYGNYTEKALALMDVMDNDEDISDESVTDEDPSASVEDISPEASTPGTDVKETRFDDHDGEDSEEEETEQKSSSGWNLLKQMLVRILLCGVFVSFLYFIAKKFAKKFLL